MIITLRAISDAPRRAIIHRTVVARAVAFLLLLGVTACSRGPVLPQTLVYLDGKKLSTRPFEGLPQGATPSSASFDGRIRLLGVQVEPPSVAPGGTVKVTAWYFLEKDLLEDWDIFVHGTADGAELNLLQDDHAPLDGMLPTSRWRTGEVIADERVLRVPTPSPVGELQLRAGFYRGKVRLPVDKREHHDGDNRVLLATVRIGEGKARPEYVAPRTTGVVIVDGKADEPDWARAPRTGPFINHDGRGAPGNETFARLMWNDEALFLLFECDDTDIWTSYTRRDEPIYNEEAVEIFIDADADIGTKSDPGLGTYAELQAAPNDVHFDAAFIGRRKGMDIGFNSSFETKALLRGTLNNPADVDDGWTSEWRIPWQDLPDLKGGVQAGRKLRFNLFRLDKPRRNGRIVGNEASAWSSPLSGDFHNVQRFGWLVLSP